MVAIYKDPDSGEVVIVGKGSYQPSLLQKVIAGGKVEIYSKGENKKIFGDIWSNITDDKGTVFTDAGELIAYLDGVFTRVERMNINFGTITTNEAQADYFNS